MNYTAAAHKEHVDHVALDIEQFVKELAEAALLNGFIFVQIHLLLFPLRGLYLFYLLLYHIFLAISRQLSNISQICFPLSSTKIAQNAQKKADDLD